MTRPKLILIGSGGHARSCIDVIERHGYFQIAGLVGLPGEKDIQQLNHGHLLIGDDFDLPNLVQTYQYALITIGHLLSPSRRIFLYQEALQLGFEFPTIIAPTAHVSSRAVVGSGTIVMHGAIVNAGATVGKNCIVNSRALIEHDVKVADHCHISTGTILNGGVMVGEGTFIGSASVIKQCINIGRNCIIGMGLSVRHDLADQALFTGH